MKNGNSTPKTSTLGTEVFIENEEGGKPFEILGRFLEGGWKRRTRGDGRAEKKGASKASASKNRLMLRRWFDMREVTEWEG